MFADWLIQLTWFAASVFATGAFWYFLSKQDYLATLWAAFAAIVFSLTAVAFHIHNDLRRHPGPVASSPVFTAAKVSESNSLQQHGADSSSFSDAGNELKKDEGVPSTSKVSVVKTPELSPSPQITKHPIAPISQDREEADIALASNEYSPITMEDFFDNWYHKATTSLQRDELQDRVLNRIIIWNGKISTIESGAENNIRVIVRPTNGTYGTAFLNFDKSQRQQLVELHVNQDIRFTGRIKSFVASPFLSDCKLLKILN